MSESWRNYSYPTRVNQIDSQNDGKLAHGLNMTHSISVSESLRMVTDFLAEPLVIFVQVCLKKTYFLFSLHQSVYWYYVYDIV